jgi:hypothetical protein
MNRTVTTVLIIIFVTGMFGNLFSQDIFSQDAENSLTEITENIAEPQTRNKIINVLDYPFWKYNLSVGVLFRNYLFRNFEQDEVGGWGAGLKYKLKNGRNSGSSTIGLATHFTFNLTRNFGIISGIEITRYFSEIVGDFEDSYETRHADGSPFIYSYVISEYSEQQKLSLLSVPLMAKFSMNPFSDIDAKYFAAVGFKVGIPVIKQAEITHGRVTTKGFFYDKENIQYADFPDQGFVTRYAAPEQQSKIDFKLMTTLTIETGITFTSNEDINSGVSIYCDIGLNNLLESTERHMLEYQRTTPERLHFNSIMMTGRVGDARILSAGLKLFVNFNLNKKNLKRY